MDEYDRFHALVSKRTGYTVLTFSYEKVMDCGTHYTFRHVMSVAHYQVCQLAHLRYAREMILTVHIIHCPCGRKRFRHGRGFSPFDFK
ncbi:TPA: hypothetical protein ACS50C_004653 [Salmonella enterica]|uniref:Uncharacterized protein n=2 Tax=Salmonella enterica TaxID=28901 RepID=A0A3V7YZE6_SALER|nr:hypothetical protein [Salmonella enterica]EBY1050043.1 hypothetical protein [Salmonella enterica subsp. enterica serovar Bareilly]EBZ6325713.1 hypothetical protein [Salmonella enterica subsp. enterica serovar Gaminara]ECF1388984.1 hypothetical protein [Salmonella enterica subsp. enterica serovar Stanley]ECF2364787.1 hypothetical protein [Salmonella enterica subsp. enterica serovar Mountpleasant]ECU8749616.1 hypothetical protein [Salmonella enterica subsp. diarizonae str. CFSAN000558]EDQ239